MKIEELENFSLTLVRKLSNLIKEKRETMSVKIKEDLSLVTNLDKEVELILREEFSNKFNDLSIVGEEFPTIEKESNYVLYIDPIDGTSAFVDKGFDYAISIGILKKGKPYFGLVYDVANDFYFMNGKTNKKKVKNDLVIIQGNPECKKLSFENFNFNFVSGFSTALGIVRVSSGDFRSYIQTSNNLKSWDINGALSYLKYRGDIVIDFLRNVDLEDNTLKSGFVVYKKRDLEFDFWYKKNKKQIVNLL